MRYYPLEYCASKDKLQARGKSRQSTKTWQMMTCHMQQTHLTGWLIVWGAIWGGGRSPLMRLEGAPLAGGDPLDSAAGP